MFATFIGYRDLDLVMSGVQFDNTRHFNLKVFLRIHGRDSISLHVCSTLLLLVFSPTSMVARVLVAFHREEKEIGVRFRKEY